MFLIHVCDMKLLSDLKVFLQFLYEGKTSAADVAFLGDIYHYIVFAMMFLHKCMNKNLKTRENYQSDDYNKVCVPRQ